MYCFNFHHVEPEPLRNPSRRHLTVTPNGLRRIIGTFRQAGLRPVSLAEVTTRNPVMMRPNEVVLTFDDGFENFVEHAVPVLKETECPGTVFVLAGKLHQGTNDWDQAHQPVAERDRLMSTAQLASLNALAPLITVGSHGLYHRPLSKLSPEEVNQELCTSYQILQEVLGPPGPNRALLPVFAYPWGDYSDAVLAAMPQSPYQWAMTTEKGPWMPSHEPFTLPRYSIYHRDEQPWTLWLKLLYNRVGIFHRPNRLSFPQIGPSASHSTLTPSDLRPMPPVPREVAAHGRQPF
jgi:peptidoglycan/xylan/chitin deacetylase (PgdA/CDA1 family)